MGGEEGRRGDCGEKDKSIVKATIAMAYRDGRAAAPLQRGIDWTSSFFHFFHVFALTLWCKRNQVMIVEGGGRAKE